MTLSADPHHLKNMDLKDFILLYNYNTYSILTLESIKLCAQHVNTQNSYLTVIWNSLFKNNSLKTKCAFIFKKDPVNHQLWNKVEQKINRNSKSVCKCATRRFRKLSGRMIKLWNLLFVAVILNGTSRNAFCDIIHLHYFVGALLCEYSRRQKKSGKRCYV